MGHAKVSPISRVNRPVKSSLDSSTVTKIESDRARGMLIIYGTIQAKRQREIGIIPSDKTPHSEGEKKTFVFLPFYSMYIVKHFFPFI